MQRYKKIQYVVLIEQEKLLDFKYSTFFNLKVLHYFNAITSIINYKFMTILYYNLVCGHR